MLGLALASVRRVAGGVGAGGDVADHGGKPVKDEGGSGEGNPINDEETGVRHGRQVACMVSHTWMGSSDGAWEMGHAIAVRCDNGVVVTGRTDAVTRGLKLTQNHVIMSKLVGVRWSVVGVAVGLMVGLMGGLVVGCTVGSGVVVGGAVGLEAESELGFAAGLVVGP